MTAPVLPRRGFLRGLASLPLIGGGVTLIGQPTAAAVPVTDALMDRYVAFVAHEHRAALIERELRHETGERRRERIASGLIPILWMPDDPDVEAICNHIRPSTRAAVILSAAGVPLVGGAA